MDKGWKYKGKNEVKERKESGFVVSEEKGWWGRKGRSYCVGPKDEGDSGQAWYKRVILG